MQEKKINVFVITRFGLGQSLESFYEREFIYLKNFLAKSILEQKEHITKWIILSDIKTPNHVLEKIKKLAPKDLLYIYSQDPFLSGSVKPNINNILKNIGVKLNDKIVTIRIDADDIFSNDYVLAVLNAITANNLSNKYDNISVDAASGIYFYPSKNKLIRVFKKGFSIQALYSVFGKNFLTVFDSSHQELEKKIVSGGGYCCTLRDRDFWLRSMRHFSVTRFGKQVGIFEGRFILIKKIIKKFFFKKKYKSTVYKEHLNINDISDRFQLSNTVIEEIIRHEKSIKNHKIKFSTLIKKIIDTKKVKSSLKLKQILLEMYQKEDDDEKKLKIKKEFYSF